ncbi:MAG: hypothetical protein FWH17_09660 [Oscillospiraceae bacterium]|nr:hypothetical protein [Oscillospiraceae bacterium]
MLFRRNNLPSCSYCVHGTRLGQDEILCIKRGIMSANGKCRSFDYEPTKREPEYAQNLNISAVGEKDFAI